MKGWETTPSLSSRLFSTFPVDAIYDHGVATARLRRGGRRRWFSCRRTRRGVLRRRFRHIALLLLIVHNGRQNAYRAKRSLQSTPTLTCHESQAISHDRQQVCQKLELLDNCHWNILCQFHIKAFDIQASCYDLVAEDASMHHLRMSNRDH